MYSYFFNNFMKIFYIYISLIAIFDLAASMFAKLWAIKDNSIYLFLTVMCFWIAGYFFAKSLKFESLAVTNIIWIVLSIVIVSIVSYFVFNEKLSLIQIIWIFVVLFGMILINIE